MYKGILFDNYHLAVSKCQGKANRNAQCNAHEKT